MMHDGLGFVFPSFFPCNCSIPRPSTFDTSRILERFIPPTSRIMAFVRGARNPYEVALRHRDALGTFNQLSCGRDPKYDDFAPVIREQFARFKVWAENVGAHRTGRVSLDHRLRDALDVKDMVIELLRDLHEALNDALAFVSTEHPPQPVEPMPDPLESPSTDQECPEEVDTEELTECLEEVAHVITCLYNFSIAIQNPAPIHRLQKSARIDVAHFEPFDLEHVSHKFPNAEPYLLQRLGRSNTRRRQLLKYHADHHDKIAYLYDVDPFIPVPTQEAANEEDHGGGDECVYTEAKDPEDEQPVTFQETNKKGPATNARSATTVTAYHRPKEAEEIIDQRSEADFSQTSYSSSASGMLQKLRVPPPPNSDTAFDGEAFQCPYCFNIITLTSEKSWKQHFFRDLRPYVCTFKDCPKADYLFDNRSEWFEHEVEIHRREYFCNVCHATSSSRGDFQSHLQQKHPKLFSPGELSIIIDRCARPIVSEQCCPLCLEKYTNDRLRRHLGKHLQQVALFVPRPRDHEGIGEGASNGAEVDDSDDEHGSGSGNLEFNSNPSRSSWHSEGGAPDIVPLLEPQSPLEDPTQLSLHKTTPSAAPDLVPCPPCPGNEPVLRTLWFRAEDFIVCEECYRDRVKASPFATFVKADLGTERSVTRCALGSAEWRALWQKRCQSGDFAKFLEAVRSKKSLEDIRFRRKSANAEIGDKARGALSWDERRRMMMGLNQLRVDERDIMMGLNQLRVEERDMMNRLEALTRI